MFGVTACSGSALGTIRVLAWPCSLCREIPQLATKGRLCHSPWPRVTPWQHKQRNLTTAIKATDKETQSGRAFSLFPRCELRIKAKVLPPQLESQLADLLEPIQEPAWSNIDIAWKNKWTNLILRQIFAQAALMHSVKPGGSQYSYLRRRHRFI